MAAQVKFTIRGGKELESALSELGGAVASRLGDNAVRAGARVLEKAVKDAAPVRTGALRDSIRVTSDPRQKRSGEALALVVSDVWYARLVEFGTVRASARSFMRKAGDEAGADVLDRTTENLWRGIERELAKRARS